MVVQRMPGETNGMVANGLSLPTMETFAYPVDAVSKGGREKAETYEPLWKIADRHRVLKVPEGREKKKKERKKERKRKIVRYLEQTIPTYTTANPVFISFSCILQFCLVN